MTTYLCFITYRYSFIVCCLLCHYRIYQLQRSIDSSGYVIENAYTEQGSKKLEYCKWDKGKCTGNPYKSNP